MSAQTQRDEEQQAHEQLDSPGKRLRIARQAKGLTQQDIASQLHLSSSIVQALEEDDFDRLPGPVFVRGYLRNYARLLDLDDRAVLNEYGGDTDSGSPLPVAKGVKPEIRSSHLGIRLMTWIIVIALIGLLAAWWQGRLEWPRRHTAEPPPVEPATPGMVDDQGSLLLPRQAGDDMARPAPTDASGSSPDAADAPGGYVPPTEARDDDVTMDSASVQPETDTVASTPIADGSDTRQEAATQSPAPGLDGAPSGTPADELAAAEAPETDVADDTATTETIDPVDPVDPVDAAPAATAGDSEVVFEFVGSCWVDIRDSTRTFKLFGEKKEGERFVLGGTPPYSVILGNSPMVRVTVDGEPFDVESHSRGNVARFTIDPANLE